MSLPLKARCSIASKQSGHNCDVIAPQNQGTVLWRMTLITGLQTEHLPSIAL